MERNPWVDRQRLQFLFHNRDNCAVNRGGLFVQALFIGMEHFRFCHRPCRLFLICGLIWGGRPTSVASDESLGALAHSRPSQELENHREQLRRRDANAHERHRRAVLLLGSIFHLWNGTLHGWHAFQVGLTETFRGCRVGVLGQPDVSQRFRVVTFPTTDLVLASDNYNDGRYCLCGVEFSRKETLQSCDTQSTPM